jgi:hypothetical protein
MDLSSVANGTFQGRVTTVGSTDTFGSTAIDLSALTASTSVITDWQVGVYTGTGAGYTYGVTAASTTTGLVTIDVAFTSTPDTDSYIRLWDVREASFTDWRVGIYTGQGAGQLFTLESADTTTQTFTVDAASTTTPDTTSKFTLWNPTEQDVNWYRLLPVRFDAVEHPNKMYIQGDLSTSRGMRLRLVYLAQPVTLDADTDETTVPRYFLVNKSLAHLHDSLVNDNRADRRDHSAIAEHHDQLARAFEGQNPRRMPTGTVWQEVRGGQGRYQIDPMGWRG